MARPAVMVNDDDDRAPLSGNGGGGNDRGNALRDEIEQQPAPRPTMADLPEQAPLPRRDEEDEPNFRVIETDDQFKPLRDGDGERQEGRLTEGEGGEGTYLDRQRADQTEDHARRRREMTPDERREDRRKARQTRNQRRDENQAENIFLRERVQQLEQAVDGFAPRFSQFDQDRHAREVADVENRIEAARRTGEAAQRAIAEAMISQDAEAMTAALKLNNDSTRSLTQLEIQKTLMAQASQGGPRTSDGGDRQQQQPPQTRAPAPVPPPSPVVRGYTEDLQQAHPWLNLRDVGSRETRAVLAIDNAVANEGYDPNSPEYWDEIEERMARAPALAHRFATSRRAPPPDDRQGERQQDRQQERQPARPSNERRGPPVSGGGDRPAGNRGGNGRTQDVYLSPGRKEALVRMGVMSTDGRVQDRAKYGRMLSQYAAFDRDNRVAG